MWRSLKWTFWIEQVEVEEEYNEESDQDWVEGQEEEEDSDADSIESLLAHPALFRDDDSLVDVDNVDEEDVGIGGGTVVFWFVDGLLVGIGGGVTVFARIGRGITGVGVDRV